MKHILLIIGLALAVSVTHAADNIAKPESASASTDLYASGQFSVSPFVGVNAAKLNPVDGKGDGGFTGLRLEYAVVKNIAISVEGAAGDMHERFIDQFAAHAKGYLPFGKSGLAGYGELGWQQFTGSDRNFMSTGAGVEVRGKRVSGFAGVRWLQDFKDVGFAQYLIGGSLRF